MARSKGSKAGDDDGDGNLADDGDDDDVGEINMRNILAADSDVPKPAKPGRGRPAKLLQRRQSNDSGVSERSKKAKKKSLAKDDDSEGGSSLCDESGIKKIGCEACGKFKKRKYMAKGVALCKKKCKSDVDHAQRDAVNNCMKEMFHKIRLNKPQFRLFMGQYRKEVPSSAGVRGKPRAIKFNWIRYKVAYYQRKAEVRGKKKVMKMKLSFLRHLQEEEGYDEADALKEWEARKFNKNFENDNKGRNNALRIEVDAEDYRLDFMEEGKEQLVELGSKEQKNPSDMDVNNMLESTGMLDTEGAQRLFTVAGTSDNEFTKAMKDVAASCGLSIGPASGLSGLDKQTPIQQSDAQTHDDENACTVDSTGDIDAKKWFDDAGEVATMRQEARIEVEKLGKLVRDALLVADGNLADAVSTQANYDITLEAQVILWVS